MSDAGSRRGFPPFTLYPSYALENHGFYHPTYEMVAGMSMGDSLMMASLADPATGRALEPFAEHNVMNVWRNNLDAMVMASGEFAYPAGLDWELHDYEQNSYLAWLAAHFGDPLARWADERISALVRQRQIVNGDGRFVGSSGGGFFREAVEARRTAMAWLFWEYGDHKTGGTAEPSPVVAHFPDVKIIVQRSASVYVSLSYGSRIMAMIEAAPAAPPTNVFVATPLYPGMVGLGALGKATYAQLIKFTTNADGFYAELQLRHANRGVTRVYFKSTGDSVAIVKVPIPAGAGTTASGANFDMGVENDPLTGGTRIVEWAAAAPR